MTSLLTLLMHSSVPDTTLNGSFRSRKTCRANFIPQPTKGILEISIFEKYLKGRGIVADNANTSKNEE